MRDLSIDPNIAKARTLDKSFYNDPALFEASKEKIFASSWQLVGDAGVIKDAGDIYPFTLLEHFLDEPLVLTRDKQGEVHCLSNVCTHRGNIVAYEKCNTPHLRCRYHGRMFRLDGGFASMPEFKEVEDFPTKDDDLKSLPLYQWGTLVFTTLNKQLPAEAYLKEMMNRLSWLPLNEFTYREVLSSEYTVKAHWALYCENYLEGFHIPFVHAGLNEVLDFGNYITELYEHSSLSIGIAKDGEECFQIPASSPDHGKNIAAYYYWVFPNMMFNFYPWGLSINIVKPVSISETKVSFLSYLWKEDKLNTGAGSGLNAVEMEDEEVVENVQKGVRSRFYKHGRFSVTREQGIHHFQQLIAGCLKS